MILCLLEFLDPSLIFVDQVHVCGTQHLVAES